MSNELVLLAACSIAAAIWYWATKGRETVDRVVVALCEELSLQRLDGSVALFRVSLTRIDGRLALVRHYFFEFSVDGSGRHRGEASLLHGSVTALVLAHPDGSIIIEPPGRSTPRPRVLH